FGTARNSLNDFLKVEKIDGMPNRNAKVSDIKGKTWDVTLYDYTLNKLFYRTIKGDKLRDDLGQYIINVLIIGDEDKRVRDLRDSDGNSIDKFLLSEFYNTDRTLVIVTEEDD